MARRRLAVAGVVFGVLLAGCAAILGFEDTTLRDSDAQAPETSMPTPDTGPGVLPDGEVPDAATPKLSVDPSPIVVRRGNKADVKVNIVRTTDIIGEITATVVDLPTGVTATTATIAAGASTGTLTVTASGAAALGSKAVKVVPSIASLPTAETQLLISEGAGELDTTFASVGFVTDGTAGNGGTFRALALSGTNVVAGGVGNGGWLVRRFGPTGTPDATFKPDANLPNDGEINALAVDAMGRVLCVGRSSAGIAQPIQLTIARLTATGALDATFGAGGIARLGGADATLFGSTGLGVAIEAAGTILVAGSRNEPGDETGILVRYTAGGARDNTFNGGAAVTVAKNRFVGVAVDGTGMVVGGTDNTSNTPTFFVTRRNANGAIDNTFGDAGAFSFGGGFRANELVRFNDGALALVGDGTAGNLYTAGSATGKGALVYARSVGTVTGATLQGAAPLGDKRLVAAGNAGGANAEARVQRLLADGNPDPTFGDGGVTFVDPGGVANGFDVTLFAALLQPDGRILAAGNRSGAGGVIYRIWP